MGKGNIFDQRAAGTGSKLHLVGQEVRGGRRLTPAPNPAPCSQGSTGEGGTGMWLPCWILSSRSLVLGDLTEGEMAMQEPLLLLPCSQMLPWFCSHAWETLPSPFPGRVWMEHSWTPKIPDLTDLRQRNRAAPNKNKGNLCPLPRARIKALQGEHFLGTSVPLRGTGASLCTPQTRETSLQIRGSLLKGRQGLKTFSALRDSLKEERSRRTQRRERKGSV